MDNFVVNSQDYLMASVTQVIMMLQSLFMVTPEIAVNETDHPIVQGARRMITSSPVGTLVFVIAQMGFFLVFGALFSSWTQFKLYIREVEISLAA